MLMHEAPMSLTTRVLCAATTLLLALAAPAQRPEGAATNFDVLRHGFHFTNYFEGDILVDVPAVGRVDLGDTSYGLCGGMTYAALDTFVAHGATPAVVDPSSGTPPEIQPGTPLRSWLYDRQVDTFKADEGFLVRRLIAWGWRPIQSRWGVTGLHVLSDREFKRKIAERLDAGRPVPLCLIKADVDDYLPGWDGLVPEGFTKNHQVLAIGYRLVAKTDAMAKHWAIDIYDPNHPDEVHTLHYHEDKRVQTVRSVGGKLVDDPDDVARHRVGGFRGFFVTPYAPKLPYWVKPDVRGLGGLALATPLVLDERAEDGFDEPGARIGDLRQARRNDRGDREPLSPDAGGKTGRQRAGRSGRGGLGTESRPSPDVKASEGDTALAQRGRPPHGYQRVDGPPKYTRMGRIVARFPESTRAGSSRVEILDPESKAELASNYGSAAFDLLPGVYDVRIQGKVVPGVEVVARQDCVMEVGAFRATLGSGTHVEVLDGDQKTVLASGYGKVEFGLPAGSYFVRVQKRLEALRIEAGKVTEF